MVRTPLNTRFESGHETNCLFGSSMTTSIAGLLRRTYFAAVAPPQPPPMTTTRGPAFGAKSPFSAGAQPPDRPPALPLPPRAARLLRRHGDDRAGEVARDVVDPDDHGAALRVGGRAEPDVPVH